MRSCNLHFLVVDDHAIFRHVIKIYLRDAGFFVTEAESAAQALEYIEGGIEFDAIITDINMPVINGIDFIKQVRVLPNYHSIPVAAISSDNRSSGVFARALQEGANICIEKVHLSPTLEQWVASTLHQRLMLAVL